MRFYPDKFKATPIFSADPRLLWFKKGLDSSSIGAKMRFLVAKQQAKRE